MSPNRIDADLVQGSCAKCRREVLVYNDSYPLLCFNLPERLEDGTLIMFVHECFFDDDEEDLDDDFGSWEDFDPL